MAGTQMTTNSHSHAVVWIDHKEARVFHFNAEDASKTVVHAHDASRQVHHKANVTGSGHAADDPKFLHAVVETLRSAHEVLILGPAGTKTALFKHIGAHDPDMVSRIVGVESSDHPTDGEVVAHARRFFAAADRKTPQKV